MKIVGTSNGNSDCKRFYVPGVTAVDKCPICNKEITVNFGDQYFSYPVFGGKSKVYFHHEECDANWYYDVIVDVVVRNVK